MHPHAQLIDHFYAALARRDGVAMGQCYHAEVHFSDPVFDLHGADAAAMWQMLCTRGRDLRVTHGQVQADDLAGQAHWEARYTFSGSGRSVHNVIEARFAFRDGLIVRHEDRFDFWRWSRQALGPAGWLLGWSSLLRQRVRTQAAAGLAQFRRQALPPAA